MNPFETLELPTTATADEVKAKWRKLATRHHPDKGGDATTFTAIREAYMAALAKASAEKWCNTCRGTGKVTRSHGFNSIKIQCKDCHGRGRQGPST